MKSSKNELNFGALCIKDYSPNGFFFQKGKYYEYYTEKHKETGIKLFFIKDGRTGKVESLPLLESKFRSHFNDTQVIRENKINWLLENK